MPHSGLRTLLWTVVGLLALAFALGNLALLGVLTRLKPAESDALALHRPESPRSLAPYLATAPEVAEEMLRLAGVRPGETVYDLGSGDGRILILAAQKFGARAVGVELSRPLHRLSVARVKAAGLADRVRVLEGDLLEADISAADVVTLYLFPEANARLRPNLEKQLRRGARVVCHDFPVPGWRADAIQILPKPGGGHHNLFLYRR